MGFVRPFIVYFGDFVAIITKLSCFLSLGVAFTRLPEVLKLCLAQVCYRAYPLAAEKVREHYHEPYDLITVDQRKQDVDGDLELKTGNADRGYDHQVHEHYLKHSTGDRIARGPECVVHAPVAHSDDGHYGEYKDDVACNIK